MRSGEYEDPIPEIVRLLNAENVNWRSVEAQPHNARTQWINAVHYRLGGMLIEVKTW